MLGEQASARIATALPTTALDAPWLPSRSVLRTAAIIVLVATIFAQPAAAQDDTTNVVCQDDSGTLQNMISGFLQITVGIGIMGLLIVWQLDELLNMFTTNPEQKRRLKQHRTGAARSAFVLVALGPLAKVAGTIMGLPLASCVDLIPF
jgi:hypothetical protein